MEKLASGAKKKGSFFLFVSFLIFTETIVYLFIPAALD